MKVLIAGSKGQAKDLKAGFILGNHFKEIVFFDDVNKSHNELVHGGFKILHTLEEAKLFFELESSKFIVAVASPSKRKHISEKLIMIGGENITFVSSKADIYDLENVSDEGVIIQMNCIISPNVTIRRGVLINVKSIVCSNVFIDEFTSIAPNVLINEGVSIGKNCIVSTGVIILPNVKIGDNVKVWMNKVVDKDIPSNTNFI